MLEYEHTKLNFKEMRKRKRYTFTLSDEIIENLEKCSVILRRSKSSTIEEAILKLLKEIEGENPKT